MLRVSTLLALALGLCVVFWVSQTNSAAQSADRPQNGVILTRLSQPMYPPVARQAHVTGDVDLVLIIGRDGAVDSVAVVSGPPLLKEAAVTSARHSLFECRKCTDRSNKYTLVYKFEIEGECECEPREAASSPQPSQQVYPQFSDAEHRVTVVAQLLCVCDPAATRVHGLKCLYLWRCGSKTE